MHALDQVKDMLSGSSNIVAFTGAGVSTESNIPDFRSAQGLYAGGQKYRYPPEVMLSHSFFIEHPAEFYDFYRNKMIFREAKPNDCHKALAKLEEEGRLKAVVTQNIDGLHQAAGSQNVLEIHGSVHRNYCMKCRKKFSLDYIMDSAQKVPVCDVCGSTVKPDVVLYEESLDNNLMYNAISYIRAADVLLVIGTSLVVYPAAGLVNYYSGNKLILINKSETSYDRHAAVVLHESAGEVMRSLGLS